MLTWYEENGKHLGFDDDTYTYRVAEDENGWYYKHIMTQDGMDGYDTAEEAMAAAEADYAQYEADMRHLLELDDEPLLDVLDDEGEWDAYWDAVAHERMEIARGLF